MKVFKITPVLRELEPELKRKIESGKPNLIAKEIFLKTGLIQKTATPKLVNPHLIFFAGDHGIAGNSEKKTYQAVLEMLNDQSDLNTFCEQNHIRLKVVDSGVNYRFIPLSNLVNAKVALGTKDILEEPAMRIKHVQKCIDRGASVINQIHQSGCNVISVNAVGTGSIFSARVLMSLFFGIHPKKVVEQTMELKGNELARELEMIEHCIKKHGKPDTLYKTLAAYGGFEIIQMCGAILQAAENKMVLLIDDFVSGLAFLIANRISPLVSDYVFTFNSYNRQEIFHHLKINPIIASSVSNDEDIRTIPFYSLVQAALAKF